MKPQQSTGRHDTMVIPGQTIVTESIPWNPHPKFAGVFLRHLVTGQYYRGTSEPASCTDRPRLYHRRSCPCRASGRSMMSSQVMGVCTLAGTDIPYNPGVVGVMPADQVHRVEAGDRGCSCWLTSRPRWCRCSMGNDNIPCCAADAIRRIRQVTINGLLTGICMLDECIAEVKTQDLQSDVEVRAALMKRVKVYQLHSPYCRGALRQCTH